MIEDIKKVCQNCKKKQDTTRVREIRAKGFQGPCGDSFCAVGCTNFLCFPVTLTICDTCTTLLAEPPPLPLRPKRLPMVKKDTCPPKKKKT
jgi:hypothetical protein